MLTASREIVATIRMRDESTQVLREVSRELDNMAREAKDVEREVRSMLPAIRDMAIGFAGAFSGQQLFAGMNRAFGEYQLGMIGVAKTTNMSGKELEQFSNQFDSLAQRMSVPIGDLQAIAQSAGQLGIKGTDDILRFTEVIGKLQTATDLTAEEGAVALARLSNVTGEGIAGMENYANVVVALGNNVAATEAEITSIASEVARSTSVYGFSTTEVAAYAAAFAQIGVSAEIGGSSLGRVMREIANAAAMGGEGMQYITEMTGLAQAQFQQLVQTDPSKALTMFLRGMNPVLNNTTKLNGVLKSLNIQGEEINKTIVPLAKNFDLLSEAQRIALEGSTSGTALNDEYLQFAEARLSAMTRIGNQFTLLMKNMGEGLAPLVDPVVDMTENVLSGLANGFADLPPPVQALISALAVAVPTILGASVALTGLNAILPILAGSLTLLTGPIGLAVAGLTGLAALYVTAGQDADAFNSALSSSDTALSTYEAAIKAAAEEQGNLGGKISETTQKMLEQARVELEIEREKLNRTIQEAGDDASGAGWNPFNVSDAGLMQDAIQSAFANLTAKLGDSGIPAINGLIDQLGKVRDGSASVDTLSEHFEALSGVTENAAENLSKVRSEFSASGAYSRKYVQDVIKMADETGLLNDQIMAIAEADSPMEANRQFIILRDQLIALYDTGQIIAREDGLGLQTQAAQAVEARDKIAEIDKALNEVATAGIRLNELDPLGVLKRSAEEAQTAVAQIAVSMEELPETMRDSLKGLEGMTDGVAAATAIIRDRESYAPITKIDWAKRDDGTLYDSGHRGGWGSDTKTIVGANGQEIVVKLKLGDPVSREEADRDLQRRIRDEFMPAAMAAAGAAWQQYTPAQQGVLTSLTYNYGEHSWNSSRGLGRIKGAVQSGDVEAVTQAILSLAGDNAGQNANRRQLEAATFANNVGVKGQNTAIDRQLTEEARQREQAAKDDAKALEDKLKLQQEFLDSLGATAKGLELETRMVGMNTRQKAELLEKERLLAEAQEKKIDLNARANGTDLTNLQLIEQQAARVGELAEKYEQTQQARERLEERGGSFLSEFDKSIKEIADGLDSTVELAAGTADALGSGISTFLDGMLDENMNFFQALRGTAASVLADIGRMLLEHAMKVLVFKHLLGFMGMGGGSAEVPTTLTAANGAVIDGVHTFAKGGDFTNGVYSAPTAFTFAGGKLGVMGEAGPEAVMPLKNHGKGYGIRFQTIDPITKKKVERIIPIGRDTTGELIASDAQLFARGGSFGAITDQITAQVRNDALTAILPSATAPSGPTIGQLSVSAGTSFQINGGGEGKGKGGPVDETTASRVSKVIENEVQSAVVKVVTGMMQPGGLLYRGSRG